MKRLTKMFGALCCLTALASAPAIARDWSEIKSSVITSYSIHYTKLYEFVNRRRIDGYCLLKENDVIHFASAEFKLCRRLLNEEDTLSFDEMLTMVMPAGVITSYSIHYTKLYDIANARCCTAPDHSTTSARSSSEIMALEHAAACQLEKLAFSRQATPTEVTNRTGYFFIINKQCFSKEIASNIAMEPSRNLADYGTAVFSYNFV